jgi:hypothetical protein
MGDAEVNYAGDRHLSRRLGGSVEQDIRGLQVEVEQAGAVDHLDGPGDGFQQPSRIAGRVGELQPLLQGSARDEFEHQIEPTVGLPDLVQRDDIRVPHP